MALPPKPGALALPALAPAPRPPTVGYLARICPAKGLHVLVDAFLRLRRMPGAENAHCQEGPPAGRVEAAIPPCTLRPGP